MAKRIERIIEYFLITRIFLIFFFPNFIENYSILMLMDGNRIKFTVGGENELDIDVKNSEGLILTNFKIGILTEAKQFRTIQSH